MGCLPTIDSRIQYSISYSEYPNMALSGHPSPPTLTASCLCFSVIGTTGTGKSSTISQVTGHSVRVSISAESVTRQCEVSWGQSEASTVVT